LQQYLRFKSRGKSPQDALTKSCYLNRMSGRNQSFIDQCIAQADQAMRTVFGAPTGSGRENPAQPVIEGELTTTDKADSIRLMRVNHAGEVCAQALYQGQALTARNRETRSKMTQAAIEENDHLVWCRQRIHELGGHTSLLNPVWFTGSLAIGAASGMLGDKWSLGFLAETEAQVVKHLEGHLQRLPEADNKSHAILEQMKTDEAKHQATAVKAGGIDLPKPAKKMMTLMSKIMTTAAYRI
jgi:ubiquinone biosynthesis monooxygenase Coq7